MRFKKEQFSPCSRTYAMPWFWRILFPMGVDYEPFLQACFEAQPSLGWELSEWRPGQPPCQPRSLLRGISREEELQLSSRTCRVNTISPVQQTLRSKKTQTVECGSLVAAKQKPSALNKRSDLKFIVGRALRLLVMCGVYSIHKP